MRHLGPPLALGAVFLGLAAAPMAGAQEVHRGALALENKQVPLPAGDWIAAGRAETPEVVSVVLLRPRADLVTEAVLVQASRQDAHPKWTEAAPCERHDLPFARTRYKSDHDLSCAYVARVAAGPAAEPVDEAWLQAQHFADAQGWALPTAWGVVGVRIAQPLAAVQVRYAAALGPGGGPGAAALADWAESAWTAVEHGLRNRLDAAAPLPALRGLPEPAVPPPPPPEAEGFSLPRAVWKTITFRLIGTTLDFSANLIASGSVATAATLSAVPILIGPWVYLGHELAWDYYGAPAVQRTVLAGLGDETPWPPETRMAETAP